MRFCLQPCCISRRQIVCMHIARDHLWGRFIKTLKVRHDVTEGRESFGRLEVTDMLADEDLRPHAQANAVLQMCANSQYHRKRFSQVNGHRSVTARASQHQLAAANYPHNRIVHMPDDWLVMYEEIIGDARQS